MRSFRSRSIGLPAAACAAAACAAAGAYACSGGEAGHEEAVDQAARELDEARAELAETAEELRALRDDLEPLVAMAETLDDPLDGLRDPALSAPGGDERDPLSGFAADRAQRFERDEGPEGDLESATEPEIDTTEIDLDEGITREGPHHYAVERSLVDEVLASPRSLASGARIVPAITEGEVNGFKIYAIRPKSLFAALGLENGDTITDIGDVHLESPDRALEAYQQVRDADEVTLEVIRRGEELTLTYEIRDEA